MHLKKNLERCVKMLPYEQQDVLLNHILKILKNLKTNIWILSFLRI